MYVTSSFSTGGCIDEHEHCRKKLHFNRCRRSTVWQSPEQICMKSHPPPTQMVALTNMTTAARNCTSLAVEEVLCGSHRRRPACMSHPPLAHGGCIDEHEHCHEKLPSIAAKEVNSIAAEEALCGSHRCRPACMSHPPQARVVALTNMITAARSCTPSLSKKYCAAVTGRRPARMSPPP